MKTPEGTVRLLSGASRAGESIGLVCRAIHQADGETGVRRILGILSLVRQHGAQAIESACAMAIELNLPTYAFVRRYVERQLASLTERVQSQGWNWA